MTRKGLLTMADALKEAVTLTRELAGVLREGGHVSPLHDQQRADALDTILAALSAAEARERVKDTFLEAAAIVHTQPPAPRAAPPPRRRPMLSDQNASQEDDRTALEDLRIEYGHTKREALELANWLHRTFYSDVTDWKPLDAASSIMTQIDNMMAGVRNRLLQVEADNTALAARQEGRQSSGDRAGLTWVPDYPDAAPTDYRIMLGHTPFGHYKVCDQRGIWGYSEGCEGWTVTASFLNTRDRDGAFRERFTTREEAQAFCDADYRHRVSALLSPQAAPVEQGEGLTSVVSMPEPPWKATNVDGNNAKREGWKAYFEGRGRADSRFPPNRDDLHLSYLIGWDTANEQKDGASS